jgi:hypothetical protein
VDFKKGVYYGKEEYKTIKYQVPGVKIYGAGKTSSGQYPDPFTSHKIAVYQYDDATTDTECTRLAERVYKDWTVDPKRRIQFKLRPNQTKPGGTYILEGDLIKVDSEASGYVITDITYSPKEVQVGTITTEATIIGQLGDRLHPIEGGAGGPINIPVSWTTQNVGGD